MNANIPASTTRYGALGAAIGRLQFWCNKLLGRHRYDKLAIERVLDMPIVVMPDVFNPRALRTGEFFAACIDSSVTLRDADVLDMGTGSGVCAIVAAKRARKVVAIDINRAAVRCARINALMNHLEDKIDVRHGDLFAPLDAERFDYVFFNPPFLKGQAESERDSAWRSNDAIERFAAGLGRYLKPGGLALVLLSTYGNSSEAIRDFPPRGFSVSIFAEREFINERVTIFGIRRE